MLCVWAMALLTIDMFEKYLTGTQWVLALGTVLALYKVSEVVDKRINGDRQA
jgi:hypothetical protein